VRPGRWWRSLLAILVVVVGYLILSTLLTFAAMAFDAATGQRGSWTGVSMAEMRLTPSLLLAVNLAPALMIPVVMIFERLLYGGRGRLHSVTGRLRWNWLFKVSLWLLPPFVGYGVLSLFVFPTPSGPGPAPQWVALLIIVLLTTPLQAAGEEYAVRGFLGRVVGSWFGSARIALAVSTVLPSLVFMVAHGAGDPWLLAYYLVFGAALALTAWLTGGLEAPIAIHALNNLVMFVGSILLTDTVGAFDRSAGAGGSFMLVAMVLVPLFGLVTVLLARRYGVARTAEIGA
jgi:membrane protease YdiL (CAAX protease family)